MLLDHLRQQLAEREAQALRRRRRTAHTPCQPRQVLAADGAAPRELLSFCSNDYLGLAAHPALREALAEGAARYGAGSGASHLINGHGVAHARLEAQLAELLSPHWPELAVLSFCTGYMANLAVLTALGRAQATLLCESLNHASLIDGARLARATVMIYPHNDVAALEGLLARCTSTLRLIVTDAVFSMDGDLAPLEALLALAERHDAWLIVDDAHGFGVLGAHGRGSLEHFGLRSQRIIYVGTLGKAAGVAGAFVAAHPTVIEWLVQSARSYIYTTAAPPAVAHAVSVSLGLMFGEEGARRRAALRERISQWRRGLAQGLPAGWRLAPSFTGIQPLILGDNDAALALSAALEARGLWVPAIRPPTVPAGTARLRVALSAAHTAEDVDRLIEAVRAAAFEVGDGP
ncbi:MAG: 8-amino-7-oxononanoate synthase [Caldimonas sp.]|jgi:8-amino-7-oxononanoate synthase|uniref:8-amino-7-oxononanoate synthase n=1 Tax=Caldimonas manganoxidans TaxID=196015 RepID=UPI000378F99E|nr:8-amino-7-oxononanoate synthase [Caldimonas manganoxidans]GIX22906.1 MAG: 8-amino-7-oxononanoate synthase [Caldimonas sp.]